MGKARSAFNLCLTAVLLLLPRTLLVSIQSSTGNPGPDVIYQVSRSSSCYQMLSRYPLSTTSIPKDVIRSMYQDALRSLGVTVSHPKLAKYTNFIHNCNILQGAE